MFTAGQQLLLPDVYSRKRATVVSCVQLHIHPKSLCIFPRTCSPVSLFPSICPSFCLRVYVFLPTCLSVSPLVPILSYRSNEGYWQSLYTSSSIRRIPYLLAYSFYLPFSVPFHHKVTSERLYKEMVQTSRGDQFTRSLVFSRNFGHFSVPKRSLRLGDRSPLCSSGVYSEWSCVTCS